MNGPGPRTMPGLRQLPILPNGQSATESSRRLSPHQLVNCPGVAHGLQSAITQVEMMSHNLWSRYVRHFVGITWHNVCS